MSFAADTATDDAQHVAHRLHVFQVRDVRNFGDAIGEQCGRHYGQHGVFCAGNFYFAIQGLLYLRNDKLVHLIFPFFCFHINFLVLVKDHECTCNPVVQCAALGVDADNQVA